MRNTFSEDFESAVPKLVAALGRHARQRALLRVKAEPGRDFKDGETLRVRVVKTPYKESCAKGGRWVDNDWNAPQIIPVCHHWRVEVEVAADAPAPLAVGVVILSNDGKTVGLPDGRLPPVVAPGKTVSFGPPSGLCSQPPLDIDEYILAFGTREEDRFDWSVLTDVGTSRGATGALGGLLGHVVSGSRGPPPSTGGGTWTRTAVKFRVLANTKMRPSSLPENERAAARELTLKQFDLSPYYPADTSSALYRVLQQVDYLDGFMAPDGIPYIQCLYSDYKEKYGRDCWRKSPSVQNDATYLKRGIDCSRTQWFVFTRAGLPYMDRPRAEPGFGYSSTHAMQYDLSLFKRRWPEGFKYWRKFYPKDEDLPMRTYFESCWNKPLRTGDLLVQGKLRTSRNGAKKWNGHIVMVIDPERYIVFGSHGSETNVEKLTPEEKKLFAEYRKTDQTKVGVEFQYVRQKEDVESDDMFGFGQFDSVPLAACWRHKTLAKEWDENPDARPGSRDLLSQMRCEVPSDDGF